MLSKRSLSCLCELSPQTPLVFAFLIYEHTRSFSPKASGHSVAYVWNSSIFISIAGALRAILLTIPRNRFHRAQVPTMELLQPLAPRLRQQRMVNTLRFDISYLRFTRGLWAVRPHGISPSGLVFLAFRVFLSCFFEMLWGRK
jgi:hypothetical protein